MHARAAVRDVERILEPTLEVVRREDCLVARVGKPVSAERSDVSVGAHQHADVAGERAHAAYRILRRIQ